MNLINIKNKLYISFSDNILLYGKSQTSVIGSFANNINFPDYTNVEYKSESFKKFLIDLESKNTSLNKLLNTKEKYRLHVEIEQLPNVYMFFLAQLQERYNISNTDCEFLMYRTREYIFDTTQKIVDFSLEAYIDFKNSIEYKADNVYSGDVLELPIEIAYFLFTKGYLTEGQLTQKIESIKNWFEWGFLTTFYNNCTESLMSYPDIIKKYLDNDNIVDLVGAVVSDEFLYNLFIENEGIYRRDSNFYSNNIYNIQRLANIAITHETIDSEFDTIAEELNRLRYIFVDKNYNEYLDHTNINFFGKSMYIQNSSKINYIMIVRSALER